MKINEGDIILIRIQAEEQSPILMQIAYCNVKTVKPIFETSKN